MQTTNTNQETRVEKNAARQGRRVTGMPSVLAISTVVVAVIFAGMLAVTIT